MVRRPAGPLAQDEMMNLAPASAFQSTPQTFFFLLMGIALPTHCFLNHVLTTLSTGKNPLGWIRTVNVALPACLVVGPKTDKWVLYE